MWDAVGQAADDAKLIPVDPPLLDPRSGGTRLRTCPFPWWVLY